jgi:hypothetical protein
MLTKTMMWVSIVVVLLALLELPITNDQVLADIVLCASGLLVICQAIRAGQYFLAIGFLPIAAAFSPMSPIATTGRAFLLAELDQPCRVFDCGSGLEDGTNTLYAIDNKSRGLAVACRFNNMGHPSRREVRRHADSHSRCTAINGSRQPGHDKCGKLHDTPEEPSEYRIREVLHPTLDEPCAVVVERVQPKLPHPFNAVPLVAQDEGAIGL